MGKYRVYFEIEGDVCIEADSEEEARSEFNSLSAEYLVEQTYCSIQVDDIQPER